MIRSEIIYDRLASYFSLFSKRKQLYLNSIDKIILKLANRKGAFILDVGAGNGIRGNNIFKKLKFKKIVFADSSSKMVYLCRKRFKENVYKLDISSNNISIIQDKFDIIICLWNVLGHIPTHKKRLKALINMRKLLKSDGKIFIDVSNRYNVAYYGWQKVFINMIKDLIFRSENNRDFAYILHVSKLISIPSSNHFFNPYEMRTLIKKSGLSIFKHLYINYSTGFTENTFLKGSLFYVLKINRILNSITMID